MSVSDACESVALRVEAQKREKSMPAIAAGDRNLNGCSIRSSGLHRYDPCACVRRIDRSDRTRRDAKVFALRYRRENVYFRGGIRTFPRARNMFHGKIANLFSKKKRRKKRSTIRSFQSFERTKSVKRVIPRFLLLGVDPIFQRFVCRVRSHRRDNRPLSPDIRRIIFFLFFFIYILKNGSAFNSVRRFDDFSSFSAIIYPRCFFPPPSSPLSFLSFIPPTVVLAPINFFVYLVFFPSPPLSFPLLFLHTSRIMRE